MPRVSSRQHGVHILHRSLKTRNVQRWLCILSLSVIAYGHSIEPTSPGLQLAKRIGTSVLEALVKKRVGTRSSDFKVRPVVRSNM